MLLTSFLRAKLLEKNKRACPSRLKDLPVGQKCTVASGGEAAAVLYQCLDFELVLFFL